MDRYEVRFETEAGKRYTFEVSARGLLVAELRARRLLCREHPEVSYTAKLAQIKVVPAD